MMRTSSELHYICLARYEKVTTGFEGSEPSGYLLLCDTDQLKISCPRFKISEGMMFNLHMLFLRSLTTDLI